MLRKERRGTTNHIETAHDWAQTDRLNAAQLRKSPRKKRKKGNRKVAARKTKHALPRLVIG